MFQTDTVTMDISLISWQSADDGMCLMSFLSTLNKRSLKIFMKSFPVKNCVTLHDALINIHLTSSDVTHIFILIPWFRSYVYVQPLARLLPPISVNNKSCHGRLKRNK
jgi:hypothetical protein